jgi:hypothetical protein
MIGGGWKLSHSVLEALDRTVCSGELLARLNGWNAAIASPAADKNERNYSWQRMSMHMEHRDETIIVTR